MENKQFELCLAFANDDNLSFEAKGLYGSIFLVPDCGTKITVSFLVEKLHKGERVIRRALTELIQRGYIIRECIRDIKGRIKASLYKAAKAWWSKEAPAETEDIEDTNEIAIETELTTKEEQEKPLVQNDHMDSKQQPSSQNEQMDSVSTDSGNVVNGPLVQNDHVDETLKNSEVYPLVQKRKIARNPRIKGILATGKKISISCPQDYSNRKKEINQYGISNLSSRKKEVDKYNDSNLSTLFSFSEYSKKILEDEIWTDGQRKVVEIVLRIMIDVENWPYKTLKIKGAAVPIQDVRNRLETVTAQDILVILKRLHDCIDNVQNIKGWIISSLYFEAGISAAMRSADFSTQLARKRTKNKFKNFEERTHDHAYYNDLEKKLLEKMHRSL